MTYADHQRKSLHPQPAQGPRGDSFQDQRERSPKRTTTTAAAIFAILDAVVSFVLLAGLLVGLYESSVVVPYFPDGTLNPWVEPSVVRLLRFGAVAMGLVGLGLLLGVVLLLMRRPLGRAILLTACAVALLVASVGSYIVLSAFWDFGMTYEPLSIVLLVAFAISALISAITLISARMT
ncbi:hypothetical protein [Nocardia rosealba]|uniref:hypothetical protein n=1 Tax=Nocardia rosealba TaxID=2878563 RepID=UPI001CD9906D|nr:hypothetical protein [Nocardia rosealba]MCA2206887.1 hypothetical protein [Nocardia rosealba]